MRAMKLLSGPATIAPPQEPLDFVSGLNKRIHASSATGLVHGVTTLAVNEPILALLIACPTPASLQIFAMASTSSRARGAEAARGRAHREFFRCRAHQFSRGELRDLCVRRRSKFRRHHLPRGVRSVTVAIAFVSSDVVPASHRLNHDRNETGRVDRLKARLFGQCGARARNAHFQAPRLVALPLAS